jgi:di/tricarboxylate transporter
LQRYHIPPFTSSNGTSKHWSLHLTLYFDSNLLFFSFKIHRKDVHLPAVGKDTPILAGDILMFAGDVTKVHDLLKIRGLNTTNQEGEILQPLPGRILVEAIVSPRSKLVGQTIRESHFRHEYEAAVISVFRSGEQLKGKIGSAIVEPGDALLLVTKPKFLDEHTPNYDGDFVWVSQVGDRPIIFDTIKMITAFLTAVTLYVLTATDATDLVTASLLAAFVVVFAGCVNLKQGVNSINVSVLVVIATSFSTALSIEKTGVAAEWASNLVRILFLFSHFSSSLFSPVTQQLEATTFAGSIGILAGVYLGTTLLTAVLSNVSAAAIMVPVAFSLRLNAPLKALLYVVMHGASADFSTPIGYQTNLMVWGPGGYKFSDYTKVGLPLQAICGCITVIVAYFAFPEGGESIF